MRDGVARKTSFSALYLGTGKMGFRDVMFEEPWWVGIDAVQDDMALFSVFTESSNPDRKSLIAYHILQQKVIWWKNDFSLTTMGNNCLLGIASALGHREICLDLLRGTETEFVPPSIGTSAVRRPLQYLEGHSYFATVQTFLQDHFNLKAVLALEYLEARSLIFISFYTQSESGLMNELLVISSDGELLFREKLGEQLKGIGQDTFFIYEGSVIFVKNRGELFSYNIV